ncbi:hypothetical protein CNMCM8980_000117 [Aspergillus fumigatiaffinis]|uniref:FAD-binding PCMH-type domain-containing protein n=1 Tax=Aspergillus fumigatiaffinis TaxID=340414 RepID=A0A8H4GUK8_9EURO|nr:hypothetical protein CNMCM6805_001849 [Aspergillus fumigatiaffinis]KAF4243210.1 hypothetical protein CNMCM8980_000117 [Aspergillus fumigatiaffinis]
MATLGSLKSVLRRESTASTSSQMQPLSETQYSDGFRILVQGSERTIYRAFIIPQLSQMLNPLFTSRTHVSVLEIGPGPKSVFGYLPDHQRRKIKRYAAFEPNGLFATSVEELLCPASETESPLPCLEGRPDIRRIQFALGNDIGTDIGACESCGDEKYDVILFCHSMYGMKPKSLFIEKALEMLVERPEGGLVVVFHRGSALHLDGLVCHRTASFPSGTIRVPDDDETLDYFAPFVAGFVVQNVEADKAVRAKWRRLCRALGGHEGAHPNHLLFSSPNIMAVFTRQAPMLPELAMQVPLLRGTKAVKSREACFHHPASIVRPTEIQHVQRCVRWALKHGFGLTVVGGGHSGHCLMPNVVSVDMGAFDQVHILTSVEDGEQCSSDSGPLVVAEAGCKSGDIIRKTMEVGLTVPLGARPSVGAGLWLQGGIGHLARLHGLACDVIVGAVVISVGSGQALCIGRVPSQHWPVDAMRAENDSDLLWALKGAGTNFGIVVSVTFKAYPAPTYLSRNWIIPLNDNLEARRKLSDFDQRVARKLPRSCSADAYLYWDSDKLHLGVTMFEPSTTTLASAMSAPTLVHSVLGPENRFKAVDGVGVFDAEMYMSGMHGGHGGSRTSSFKRCLFLNRIGAENVADVLVAAVRSRPSSLCYLHLLQGGGAVSDTASDATAFGCRTWDFACVVTGVWPRDQDESEVARGAVQWVYNVARDLLPLSVGVYAADLGPDPRDAMLAAKAFGPNLPRLSRLKQIYDPRNVLAYACPLPKAPMEPNLIILVTGESCAGKDYCAEIWASAFITCAHKSLTARAVSISDVTKREYAATTGADLNLLLRDRGYKEQHRPALSEFFQSQARHRPRLLEEQFLKVVYSAVDVNVLLITGMRDEAPVTTFSHLVPDSRMIEVHVKASSETRRARRGCQGGDGDSYNNSDNNYNNGEFNPATLNYRPTFIFDNDAAGSGAASMFADRYLLPFLHEDLQKLANMIRTVPDFPRPGIDFRHVLDIAQQQGGLAMCAALLQTHFSGDWGQVDVVACCEAGGFVYAAALASQVDVPLALIREAGKLPQPTVSVVKPTSHISYSASKDLEEKRIELERGLIPRGASVVVVDDVLATGNTLCAVLQLLERASIHAEDVNIMAVAEFPVHRGRELLRRRGFGAANIQSLLVFGGA